jgi:hypothetical protein
VRQNSRKTLAQVRPNIILAARALNASAPEIVIIETRPELFIDTAGKRRFIARLISPNTGLRSESIEEYVSLPKNISARSWTIVGICAVRGAIRRKKFKVSKK